MAKFFTNVVKKEIFSTKGEIRITGEDDLKHCARLDIIIQTDATSADVAKVTIHTTTAKGVTNIQDLFTTVSIDGGNGAVESLTNPTFSDIIIRVGTPTTGKNIYVTVLASNN